MPKTDWFKALKDVRMVYTWDYSGKEWDDIENEVLFKQPDFNQFRYWIIDGAEKQAICATFAIKNAQDWINDFARLENRYANEFAIWDYSRKQWVRTI